MPWLCSFCSGSVFFFLCIIQHCHRSFRFERISLYRCIWCSSTCAYDATPPHRKFDSWQSVCVCFVWINVISVIQSNTIICHMYVETHTHTQIHFDLPMNRPRRKIKQSIRLNRWTHKIWPNRARIAIPYLNWPRTNALIILNTY